MLQVLLTRNWRKADYTIGKLYVNGQQLCNSLEPPDRHLFQGQPIAEIARLKVKKQTAIPTGTYRLQIVFSPKFNRELIEIMDVPGFSSIRIHAGNRVADTEACVLPGINSAVGMVTESRKYETQLTGMVKETIAKGEQAFITII